MFKNYITTAFRALWRNKIHSFINVFGLGLGVACCILIVLFVRDEWTFDHFHSKADRIYRVYAKEDYGKDQKFFYTTTPFPMGPALKDNFQEVEQVVRLNNISPQIRIEENLFSEQVTIAGQDFLKVFDFEVINGDAQTALSDINHVLLTQTIARKYFGEADPLDKIISMQVGDNFEEFIVKAVVQDPPVNSSIQFTMLIPDLNYKRLYSEHTLTSAWFNIQPETYVLLQEGVNAEKLMEKFPPVFKTLLGADYEQSHYFVGLQPFLSIHLDTSFPAGIAPVSDPRYSYILAAIAILILFVACINFVTLSVGRSLKRSKEVGIRKVAGAYRQQLIFQFIGEAVIVTVIALTIGLIISYLSLPLFNVLSGKQLSLKPDGFMLLVSGALTSIIGLLAGSYPAFILSGFKPVSILKGSVQGGSRQQLRKVLVGVQLVLSIFLISSTLVMRRQLNYIQNKNLGFDQEQLAVIQLKVKRGRLSETLKGGFEQAQQFKTELNKLPGVINICASSHDFGHGAWTEIGYTDIQGVYRTFYLNTVDQDYIPDMKIELLSGRNFSVDGGSDSKRGIIINEALAKEYGWENPVGQRLPGKRFGDHEIIGVVKDFHYASLYSRVAPLVLTMDALPVLEGTENINFENSPKPKLLVRLQPGQIAATLEKIKDVWLQITGEKEFACTFVDQSLQSQYRNEQNLGKIVSIATVLAIIIGSLGLYALASLAMHNKVKEISIRKVLGATEQSLLVLLAKDYVYLILIALLIAVPITWYMMSNWLSSFEYQVGIGPGIFLVSGGISLVIALLTISYQAIRTAWSEPAQTLKHE